MPALTKPMTITLVAPDDCIAAVASAPMPTPTSLLFEVFAKSRLSLLELTDSRLELIILQAIRKIPMPAMRARIAFAIVAPKFDAERIVFIISKCLLCFALCL